MLLAVPYTAYENRIPKGCRKPRLTEITDVHKVMVHEIESDRAPVALVVHPARESNGGAAAAEPTVYRFFDHGFWVPMRGEEGERFASEIADPASLTRSAMHRRASIAEIHTHLNRWAHDRLLIDDVPHRRIDEPFLEVALHTSFAYASVTVSLMHAPPSTRPTRDRFPVTQLDAAMERAAHLYECVSTDGHWQNASAPTLPATFDIRMPEVFRHCFEPSEQTPTRVKIEFEGTARATGAWEIQYQEDNEQGFRLLDGRQVVPVLGFAFVDPETKALIPIAPDDAAALGFSIEPETYRRYRQRTATA